VVVVLVVVVVVVLITTMILSTRMYIPEVSGVANISYPFSSHRGRTKP